MNVVTLQGPASGGGASGAPPDRRNARRARTASEITSHLGMVIFLGAWAMMFTALFFSYGVVRIGAPSWPPPDSPTLPWRMPLVNTLVLLGSSFTLHQAVRTIRNWRVVELPRWIAATLVLGLVFLGLQLWVWRSVWLMGLRPSTNIYGSVFYALTTVHALHVVGGLIALLVVLIRAVGRSYRKDRHGPLRLAAMFWHFIDIVWVLMFVAIYLV